MNDVFPDPAIPMQMMPTPGLALAAAAAAASSPAAAPVPTGVSRSSVIVNAPLVSTGASAVANPSAGALEALGAVASATSPTSVR